MSTIWTMLASSSEPLLAWMDTDGDPTDLPVKVAVVPHGTTPGPSDWDPATWHTEAGRYAVAFLAGPLPKGFYQVFTQVTDPPGQPEKGGVYINVT